MIVRTRHWIAAALGLCLGQSSPALAAGPVVAEPPLIALPGVPLPSLTPAASNQKLADSIAEQLRQSGRSLRPYWSMWPFKTAS